MSAQFVVLLVASWSQSVVACPLQVAVAGLSQAAVVCSLQAVVASRSQVALSGAAKVVVATSSQVVWSGPAKSVVATSSQVVLSVAVKAAVVAGLDELDNESEESAAILFFELLREVRAEVADERPLATQDRVVWSPVVSVMMAAMATFGSS